MGAMADTWRLNPHVLPAQPNALEYLQATGAWDHDAPNRQDLLRGDGFHHALITAPAAAAHADARASRRCSVAPPPFRKPRPPIASG